MQKKEPKKKQASVNKQVLISQVAKRTDMDPEVVSTILNAALDDIIYTVAQGEKVGLTGFGVFSSRERKGREGVDPRTFKRIMIDAVTVPHFKPGQSFKEAVRQSDDGDSPDHA
ncbi:MAG: HU family DNA-binding protein [Clostridia bacterium]|nr:HU family DNA-binding protein [Clostridia bacterium]